MLQVGQGEHLHQFESLEGIENQLVMTGPKYRNLKINISRYSQFLKTLDFSFFFFFLEKKSVFSDDIIVLLYKYNLYSFFFFHSFTCV